MSLWGEIKKVVRAITPFGGDTKDNIADAITVLSGDPFITTTGVASNSILSKNEKGISDALESIGDAFTGGDDIASTDADETIANLLKAEFEDWEKTFKPVELNLINEMSSQNPAILTKALDDAQRTVTGSYDSMEDIVNRQNRALGIRPTDQEGAASKRLMDLGEALSVSDAKNTARSNVRQMDEALLMGTTPNPNIVKAV